MTVRDRRKQQRRIRQTRVAGDRRLGERRAGTDRREEDRVPLELWMEEVSGDEVYFRRTANISPAGVFFERAIPHAPGTVMTLKFALPGNKEMIVARGKVVSTTGSKGDLGMRVKFISVEGDGIERIKAYLRGL
jgi:hypothetical protein